MSLLRWIQGNSSSQASSNPSNTQKQQTGVTSAAGQNAPNNITADPQIASTTLSDGPDAKRFGFENVSGQMVDIIRLLTDPVASQFGNTW